jgi:hypothetical protein
MIGFAVLGHEGFRQLGWFFPLAGQHHAAPLTGAALIAAFRKTAAPSGSHHRLLRRLRG